MKIIVKFIEFVLVLVLLNGCSSKSSGVPTGGPESNAASSIAAYDKDGRIYVASTTLEGDVVYSTTSTPDNWSTWEPINSPPPGGFSTDTSPILLKTSSINKELRIYARGSDNNLYRAIKVESNPWSSWELLISDGNISGNVSITLTRGEPSLIPEEHIVYSSNGNCEYHRITDSSGHIKNTWQNCVESVIASDSIGEVGVVLRSENTMDFKIIKRTSPLVAQGSGSYAPNIQALTQWDISDIRTLSKISFSISSLVRFGNNYHVVFSNRELLDDVSMNYKYSLKHLWFVQANNSVGLSYDLFEREVREYLTTGISHPIPELILYRNKLLSLWSFNGNIGASRWDNADPAFKWIDYPIVGNGKFKPSIISYDRRSYISDYGSPQYGNDAYAIVSDTQQNGKSRLVVISKELMRYDINRELTLYDSHSDTLAEPCNPPESLEPTIISNIDTEKRAVLTEIGFNLWMFPDWMTRNIYSGFTDFMCNSPEGVWKDGQTPCQTQRLPVYIKAQGGMFNCRGAWINRDKPYFGVWEELGHYFGPSLGFGTAMVPSQSLANITGIPLSTLNEGRLIFSESLTACNTPSPRCTGFTGIGGNYDAGGVEHSFMYVIYYYLIDGDLLRSFIAEDLLIGNNLLQRKYNWIKNNIFRGIEYRDKGEPI